MARKEKNIHYIYKTTCNVTGKWYIGMHSTTNLDDGYMGSGKILRYSIRKYGVDNHTKEILEFCETRELLIEAEKKVITSDMIVDKNCMNLKEGGDGGFSSEEHMMKCSEAGVKARQNLMLNNNIFIERIRVINREKIKNGIVKPINEIYNWNGKSHSDETKKLMSESSKGQGVGENNSQFGTCWITKDGLNKKIKKEDLDDYLAEGWFKGRK